MQKLIQGIHQFQKESFQPLQGLFEELAKGQNPETLKQPLQWLEALFLKLVNALD